MAEYTGDLSEFAELFNRQQYFEAHEALERGWRKAGGRNDFYKGLIQLAAVLVHVQRNNLRGAGALMRTAEKNLAPYFPAHEWVKVEALCREIKCVVETACLSGRKPDEVQYPMMDYSGPNRGE